MNCCWFQTWTWALVFSVYWTFVAGEPVYMVVFPAVIRGGSEIQFCSSLLQPNETITLTAILHLRGDRKVLFQHTSNEEFHICSHFQAPLVEGVKKIHVEARGLAFYSEKIKKVDIRAPPLPFTIIQTDKPMYLPGQTVHFRVFTLDIKFRPINGVYHIIEIKDRAGHTIGQWLNMSSNSKLVQLSHPLNSEAPEGKYKITVVTNHGKIEHFINVNKYVLPKFSIHLKSTSELSIGEKEYEFQVCGKYVFGQGVRGTAEVELCQHPFAYSYGFPPKIMTSQCYTKTQEADKDGCAPFSFEIPETTAGMQDKIFLKAKFEEHGTGIVKKLDKTIERTYAIGWVSFIEAPSHYKTGSVVSVKVKAIDFRNNPIPDSMVYLFCTQLGNTEMLQQQKTNSEGIVNFMLNTTQLKANLELWASLHGEFKSRYHTPHYSPGFHELFHTENPRWINPTESALEVTGARRGKGLACGAEQEVFIIYTLMGEKKGPLHVMYLIVSKGEILKHGHYSTEVQGGSVIEGVVPFTFVMTGEMTPQVEIVAYAILPSKKIIAATETFGTELCFNSEVSVEFSTPSAVPQEGISVKVQAPPHSLCALKAIDQSVLLKDFTARLSGAKLIILLPNLSSDPYPREIEDHHDCGPMRKKRSMILEPDLDKDAHSVLKDHGLKIATNLLIPIPTCLNLIQAFDDLRIPLSPGRPDLATSGQPGPIQTIRDFFPETWIWDLVDTGESGSHVLPVSAPDTIATWEMEVFCLSPQGFGLAPRKHFTVFQPFFLELSLPYSIIRGESFELKATVFNFLTSCMMVVVEALPSQDFSLTPTTENSHMSCMCANDRKTLNWTLVPSVLGVINVTVRAEAVSSDASCDNEIVSVPERGRIDVVTKALIVKAEGTEMTNTHNYFLCPKGETLTEEISLQLPSNVIPGSARGSVSVLGDILGRSMENLDGMLQMPYGCGEQNIALLAPNIYIVEYLKNTKQLTAVTMDKARNFMVNGYQRQMNYMHLDGSYSTFGRGQGNTWLTAFVLRCFAKAREHIFIDRSRIEQATEWLVGKQKRNGCFVQKGKLFNNRMKGGVSDEVTLTAYISAAFLELNMSVSHPVMNKSLSCLRESLTDLSNTYATALLAYVFTLAQDTETRAHLLNHLYKVVHEQDGSLYWSQRAADSSDSLSVEISSYVLLAKLKDSPSAEDLSYSSHIVQWLMSQQNQYGGFTSTQDTVVALQALALYSMLTYSPEGSSTVMVQSPSAQMRFEVCQENRLLYQERPLPHVTGQYSVQVQGSACVSVQISLHYNIPTPTVGSGLSVTSEVSCHSTDPPDLSLKLMCLYFGEEDFSNMVILDIKVLSGFAPHPESLKELQNNRHIDRVDQKEDHFLLYFKWLKKNKTFDCHLKFTQNVAVHNLKPAIVKIYDYYQPSNQAETEYSYQCAEATTTTNK